MSTGSRLRAAALPTAVFAAAAGVHYVWLGLFPETDPAQARWVLLPEEPGWWQTYREAGSYSLGYSYALAAAFAAAAVRRFLRERSCAARNLALGGVTFSGALAAAGCFAIGCCGSPMLAVWLGLFGAAFLPFAKPLVAAFTTVTVAGAWLWMARQGRGSIALLEERPTC